MTTAPAQAGWRFRQPSVIPGFGLTLGFSLAYLTLIILIPLTALVLRSASLGVSDFLAIALDRRTLLALKVSFGTALIAAAVNVLFGTLVAWVLVRYTFPGRRIVDAMVDLPFALPTAVAGIALTTLYAPRGWLGALLAPLGIKVAYTPLGIIIALIFIGLPFVVRTLQPVLEDLQQEIEEAAATLGATRWQTFTRVILPLTGPGLVATSIYGFIQAWNEFTLALVVMSRPEKQTLPLWLSGYADANRGVDWGAVMAGSTLIAIPVVIFFLLVQNRMTSGLMAGAVKG